MRGNASSIFSVEDHLEPENENNPDNTDFTESTAPRQTAVNPFDRARAPLPVPDSARTIQATIIHRLERLVAGSFASGCDPAFQTAWQALLTLTECYQEEILKNARRNVTCSAGCASCCRHWVEDVNSFEAEAIASWLRQHAAEKIPAITDRCRRDGAALSQLQALVEARLALLDPAEEGADIDPTDLLLASFYRLRKPCPLLDAGSRSCLVYPLRPLTCRMYVSFSAPAKCVPSYPDDTDIPTYLFDLEEEADVLIDRLHFKFMKFEGDTGLRSLVLKYLEH